MHIKNQNMDTYLKKLAHGILRDFQNKSRMAAKEYDLFINEKNVLFSLIF